MGSWDIDESSGFLTNFRGRVADSYANTDPNYNKGESVLVIWEMEDLEVLQEWEGDIPDPMVISFPVGKGWFTEDNELLEHERGKEKFHASSVYGKLVGTVAGRLENFGTNASRTDGEDLDVDLSSAMPVLEERGTPEHVGIWKGFTFEFAEVHFDYGTDKDGKPMGSNRTMPAVVVAVPDGAGTGTKGAAGAKKAAAKPAAAKKTASTRKAAASSSPASANSSAAAATATEDRVAAAKAKAAAKKVASAASTDEEADANDAVNPFAELVEDAALAEELATALADADDFDSFIAACVAIDAVNNDDDLLAVLLDEDAGPWAVKAGG